MCTESVLHKPDLTLRIPAYQTVILSHIRRIANGIVYELDKRVCVVRLYVWVWYMNWFQCDLEPKK